MIGGFRRFRLVVESSSVERLEEFIIRDHVKDLKFCFQPSDKRETKKGVLHKTFCEWAEVKFTPGNEVEK